eukprot:scaffold64291_cov69-Attheya_sp.AAC.1
MQCDRRGITIALTPPTNCPSLSHPLFACCLSLLSFFGRSRWRLRSLRHYGWQLGTFLVPSSLWLATWKFSCAYRLFRGRGLVLRVAWGFGSSYPTGRYGSTAG